MDYSADIDNAGGNRVYTIGIIPDEVQLTPSKGKVLKPGTYRRLVRTVTQIKDNEMSHAQETNYTHLTIPRNRMNRILYVLSEDTTQRGVKMRKMMIAQL